MKPYVFIALLLTSCLTMTQTNCGEVESKFTTTETKFWWAGKSGGSTVHTYYFLVTKIDTFQVSYKDYKMVDVGEVYFENHFHLDGTKNNYKTDKELYY